MSACQVLSRAKLVMAITGALLGAGCNPPAGGPPAPQSGSIAPRVIPLPTSITLAGGAPFQLTKETRVTLVGANPEVGAIGETLAALLRRATDFPAPVSTPANGSGSGSIEIRLGDASLGDDGYRLVVTSDSVRLVAGTPAGLFHGVQTIRQLLPADIESDIGMERSWPMPALTVVDRPRFGWRGSMLDPARHFLTVKEVEQYIDLLAMYKLNVLHLHLTDDQGWRIQINSRPKLTAVGSLSQVGGGPGGFYTQQDYQEIVRYAQARYITIVPEIEMPGHSSAATTAYPEVSCSSTFCVDKEETYALLDDVVREVSALTPGMYFHIGGDEVVGLTPEQYARFVERAQTIVNKYGKQMIGWEEIAKAHIKPTTIVQQWKSDSVTAALQYGSKLILSPSDKAYLDMKYTATTELGLTWAAMIEVNTAYNWDPALYMPGVTEQNVVGVEAPIWGETVRNIAAVEYLAMPRLAALAEVAWTPQASREWSSFRSRLAAQAPRWNYLGVNYYRSPLIPWSIGAQ
ncbi:MAG TPA: beta-N-acetylhexosaminidase [Gemmatimonadaceae bacterium]|nr:beta-N-acetylhexosaminidase [Gemmatimonadaceae bacterium]